jgi:hypothetical protein
MALLCFLSAKGNGHSASTWCSFPSSMRVCQPFFLISGTGGILKNPHILKNTRSQDFFTFL